MLAKAALVILLAAGTALAVRQAAAAPDALGVFNLGIDAGLYGGVSARSVG